MFSIVFSHVISSKKTYIRIQMNTGIDLLRKAPGYHLYSTRWTPCEPNQNMYCNHIWARPGGGPFGSTVLFHPFLRAMVFIFPTVLTRVWEMRSWHITAMLPYGGWRLPESLWEIFNRSVPNRYIFSERESRQTVGWYPWLRFARTTVPRINRPVPETRKMKFEEKRYQFFKEKKKKMVWVYSYPPICSDGSPSNAHCWTLFGCPASKSVMSNVST